MQTALEKLKKDVSDRYTVHFGGTSCSKVYEIKRLAMTEYFFYYNYHILHQGFSDLKKYFRPYIEAIICSNSDAAEAPSHFGDMEITNEKYHISCIDFDIITKFISSKELNTLITTYNVKKLNVDKDEIVPRIKDRIEKKDASEAEKKILYGFLLDKEEIWKV